MMSPSWLQDLPVTFFPSAFSSLFARLINLALILLLASLTQKQLKTIQSKQDKRLNPEGSKEMRIEFSIKCLR